MAAPLPGAEAGEVRRIESDDEMRELLVVAPADDVAVPVDPGDGGAIGERHLYFHRRSRRGQDRIELVHERVAAFAGQRRDGDAWRVGLRDLIQETRARGGLEPVDLVEH